MLTKKHFVEIADILNANGVAEGTVEDFADYFADENPQFNRKVFLAAALKGNAIVAQADARRLARKAGLTA